MRGDPLLVLYRFIHQVVDPRRAVGAVPGFYRFFRSYIRYKQSGGSLPVPLSDLYPQVHDDTPQTPFDPHYLFQSNWAMREILRSGATEHVDVGSQVDFVTHLSAMLPVKFIDIRPLKVELEGLTCLSGSLLTLPFPDLSQSSVSCLHVIEHVGLGRYGDPLDPSGSERASAELSRILAPDGKLYVSTPIGRPRVCFNAHRVRTPGQVVELFRDLTLVQFSAVDDNRVFVRDARLEMYDHAEYACGLFIFRRPSRAHR
jgi:SAM-dependent methyltransferase